MTHMPNHTQTSKKTVLVHRGARDAYQVAVALSQAGLLDTLVTDLYWPAERPWANRLSGLLPAALRASLLQRHQPDLPSSSVHASSLSGIVSFALDKLPRVPFPWRQRATRWADASLGKRAGQLATSHNAHLLSYSYYGYHAFHHYSRPGLLFQLHPHPASVRRILEAELQAHPDCAGSLRKEWELSLAPDDFARLIQETNMASGFLAASSFTKRTLVENGARPESITVVPYGVDSRRFSPPAERARDLNRPLRLLFVGTINQRKGIKYLLEALRLLNARSAKGRHVHLTVCGRVVDRLELFEAFAETVDVRPSVSFADLLAAYREADLFVFPSVAEGFAQVLLESLACGLPILSTTHTAAPDLIEHGVQGFVVDPRRPDLLAERIEWTLSHRGQLWDMRQAARERATEFSLERFRTGVASAVRAFQQQSQEQPELVSAYV